MADVLPQNFPSVNSPIVASYDFIDIEEGTGSVIYYAFKAEGADWRLTRNSNIPSLDAWTRKNSATGTTGVLDIDLEVTFNLRKIIKGDMIISIPIYKSGSPTGEIQAVVTAYHVDAAATATQLATDTHTTTHSGSNTTSKESNITISLPISKKLFASGETLRVNIDIDSTTSNNPTIDIGHDPTNRITGSALLSSQMLVSVPFKLDI